MAGFLSKKKTERLFSAIMQAVVILVFILIAILFLIGVIRIQKSTIDKQQKSLETAIDRDIIQCYCLEGTYPPSLDYLKDHYGLVYDENYFFVDYRPIASNLYPDVTILRIK